MKHLLYILCLLSLIFSKNNFNELCEENINSLAFNYPEIDSRAISPDGKFILEINQDASVLLIDLILGQEKLLLPPIDYGCGSIGCSTPEKRSLFTSNGKYAITSTSYIGGNIKIWEVGYNIDSWVDITDRIIMQYGGLSGFLRLSPNNNFIAILEHSWKTGLSLHLISWNLFLTTIML